MKIIDQSHKMIVDDRNYDIALQYSKKDDAYMLMAHSAYGTKEDVALALYKDKDQAQAVFKGIIDNTALGSKVFDIQKMEVRLA